MKKTTILICPLNWGLGHASRMVPVIDEFLKQNCRVVVATSGKPLQFLKGELGDKVEYMVFFGANIKYPKGEFMFMKLFLQLPKLLFSIYREYLWINKQAEIIKPDIIVSDNRYGARSSRVTSIFVTHQLQIQLPAGLRWMSVWVNMINHWFVKSFDVCWVPDIATGQGLSGVLSHGTNLHGVRFTGPLSRFHNWGSHPPPKDFFLLPPKFLLVILSGPEPQRTLLENLLEEQLHAQNVVWFRGLPDAAGPKNRAFFQKGNHYWFDHAHTSLMAHCINKSELVICRSGYSSVMDLCVFAKKALFIPTPGQTEQEYLAKLLSEQKYVASLEQKNIVNLSEKITFAKSLKGLPLHNSKSTLSLQVSETLKKLEHHTPC